MTGTPASLSPAARYIWAFAQEYVTPQDQALLDLVFMDHPTQSDLDACLRVCDIEVLGANKVLMFSYLLHEHPELDVSGYAGPRIKSLMQFFRFANMKVLAHFSRIGKALNTANIPLAIFKGAAMKALRPALSRPMGDVDILVRPQDLDEAVRVCETLGYYDGKSGATHAVDIFAQDGSYAVDIHRDILQSDETSHALSANVLARARKSEAFGVELLLPAHEDLLFISLANLLKNLRLKTSIHGLFYALFDFKFFLADKPGFDWTVVRKNAELTGQTTHIALAVAFVHALVPGLLREAANHFPLTDAIQDFCHYALIDDEYYKSKYRDVQKTLAAEAVRGNVFWTPLHALYENRRTFPDTIRQHMSNRAFGVDHAY